MLIFRGETMVRAATRSRVSGNFTGTTDLPRKFELSAASGTRGRTDAPGTAALPVPPDVEVEAPVAMMVMRFADAVPPHG
jgi:hypothetical protein